MISRLTASAVLFAILATATLSFAAGIHAPVDAPARPAGTASAAPEIVTMPVVTVTGHRER